MTSAIQVVSTLQSSVLEPGGVLPHRVPNLERPADDPIHQRHRRGAAAPRQLVGRQPVHGVLLVVELPPVPDAATVAVARAVLAAQDLGPVRDLHRQRPVRGPAVRRRRRRRLRRRCLPRGKKWAPLRQVRWRERAPDVRLVEVLARANGGRARWHDDGVRCLSKVEVCA